MNKNDLIAAVADDTSLTKADAAKAVDSVFDNFSGDFYFGHHHHGQTVQTIMH